MLLIVVIYLDNGVLETSKCFDLAQLAAVVLEVYVLVKEKWPGSIQWMCWIFEGLPKIWPALGSVNKEVVH